MLLLAEITLGLPLILLGGLLCLCSWIMRRQTKFGSEPAPSDRFAPQPMHPRQQSAAVSHQAAQAEVRLHDLARDLEARLHTRCVMLEQLLQDAEHTTHRLEQRLRELEQRTAALSHSSPRDTTHRAA